MAPLARFALCTALGLAPALAPDEAEAKAAYTGLEDTIESAEIIAIVKAERTSAADIDGEHWHYRQSVDARVLGTIKGPVVERIEIAANRDFICAPVPYDAPAYYLVFLARDAGHLATVNNEWGALQIVDGQVEWPYTPRTDMRPLADVVLELQTLVGVSVPTTVPMTEPAPAAAPVPAGESADEQLPAPLWIASGALAVVLGLLVATRRRRR